jgi:hypothetical protein
MPPCPVPPVREALVDGAVCGQGGEEAVQSLDAAGNCSSLFVWIIDEEERGGEEVGMDPRVPVVDVAVQPEPVPVEAFEEGLDDPFCCFLADAAAQARGPGIQLFTEGVVQPGELGRNLPGAQVQVRP